MLVLSPLRSSNDERKGEVDIFPADFPDFGAGNLLDSIDFDDIFSDIGDGDVLPDLEMDPEILAEFSVSSGEELDMKSSILVRNGEEEKGLGFGSSSCSGSGLSFTHGEEIVSKRDESIMANPPPKDTNSRGEKSAMLSKSSHGKRKVKVDWTPELHRRFVQAVEQLGVDKAVPSRILELMGIDCLTRHNIASHLQKYRSHRKHLLAREAEAASWSQRRQMYGGGGGGSKREMRPWTNTAPIMGFPPTPLQPFRPLHVWGHPTVDQSLVHIWPKHLIHSSSPPPPHWAPPPPDPSYWHPLHQRVPNALAPGTPYFPQPLQPTMRFPTPPVPGIPPLSMYKVDHSMAIPSGQLDSHPLFDFHPSKESIDAAIGDVLSKPWLPLPLGLKQPSVESVLVELQHQGVPKIPSSCA